MDKIIMVNAERCMGCHSCELACAVAHSKSKELIVAINEKDRPVSKVILERFGDMVTPIHCRHCEDAPCVIVCPSGAITKPSEDAPVILTTEKCIGCHACIIVCPFGVIKRGHDGKSLIKCDLCFERLREGQKPACAEACITGAIQYISVEEITEGKREEYIKKYRVAIQKEVIRGE